jgi:hypothetical protein
VLIFFYSADMRNLWPLEFKVVTPILYFIFLVAQVVCAFQLYFILAMKHRPNWVEEKKDGVREFSRSDSRATIVMEVLKDEEANATVEVRRTES